MHANWALLLTVWAIVELIGFFRKNEYRNRMKSAAIWSTVLTSLSEVGKMTAEQNSLLQLASCLVFYGVFASILYFARLKLYMLWQNRKVSGSEQ